MASKLPVWGIDVGQCSLKAIKLQAVDNKVEAIAFDLVEHDSILSQAQSETTALITKSIQTFASRNDLSNSRIVVSVAGQQTLTRFTKMPPVEPKKIPDMVQYEASQQIPFDMDEVVWDYQVFTAGDAPDVEVGIFAIRKELIRNYLSHFTSQGIEPFIVQTSPMASYNCVRYEVPPAEGETMILLDMGALTTDLIVFDDHRIWSRPVPIGGNRFTEALVSAFKIPFAKAEKLKRNAATSKYARQVFQAMRPVFADLVSEIQRSIGYYTSTHREAHITQVIGMGNAFKLPGLQKFLQQNLTIKMNKLGGFQKIGTALVSGKPEFNDNVMSLSVATGLALQGLGLAKVNSNLLPAEVLKTILWRKKQPWFIGAAACLALSAGALWVSNVMAGSKIAEGLGGLQPDNIRAASVSNPQQAMSIVSNPGATAPIEKASKISGAVKQLKSALSGAGSPSSDAGVLNSLAKYPKFNILVPRVLDTLYKGFEEALPDQLRRLKTSEEYVAYARSTPRQERKAFWIERVEMKYGDDPGQMFPKTEKVARGGPGWAIQVTGVTTEPSEQAAARWLQDNLVTVLDRVGKMPDRGIWIEKVTIGKITPRGEGKANDPLGTGLVDTGAPQQQSSSGRGGPSVFGRHGQRPGAANPARDSAGVRGHGGGNLLNPRTNGPEAEAGSVKYKLNKIKESLEDADPLLPEEKATSDMRFILEIVVRKGDTPKDKIPDVYKPKPAEKPAPAAAKKS